MLGPRGGACACIDRDVHQHIRFRDHAQNCARNAESLLVAEEELEEEVDEPSLTFACTCALELLFAVAVLVSL